MTMLFLNVNVFVKENGLSSILMKCERIGLVRNEWLSFFIVSAFLKSLFVSHPH